MRDLLEAVRKALAVARGTGAQSRRSEGRSAEPEYAIAGSFGEFMIWRSADRKGRSRVKYLATAERAEELPPGTLHCIGSWERSPARSVVEALSVRRR
jgi:hypothetical protein